MPGFWNVLTVFTSELIAYLPMLFIYLCRCLVCSGCSNGGPIFQQLSMYERYGIIPLLATWSESDVIP